MNIHSLLEKANLYLELVTVSGFDRDIDDFIKALAQPQNRNLIFLKDVSSRVKNTLEKIGTTSLSNDLRIILKDTSSFLDQPFIDLINEIESDPKVTADDFYNKLNSIHTRINKSLGQLDKCFKRNRSRIT